MLFRFSFIAIIFLFQNTIFSQNSAFTESFELASQTNELKELIIHNNEYYFQLNELDATTGLYHNSILKTDNDFNIIAYLPSPTIRGKNYTLTNRFEIIGDKLLMVSNAEVENTNKLFSHYYSLDFTQHHIIDSLDLGIYQFDSFLNSGFKPDLNDTNLIAYGNLFNPDNNSRSPINALQIEPEGRFKSIKRINNQTYFVKDFVAIPDSENYLLGTWSNGAFLLDSNFVFIDSINVNGHSYAHCNIPREQEIECITYKRSTSEFAVSIIDYEISNDTLSIENLTPLNNSDEIVVDNNITQMEAHIDKNKNSFIVYSENISIYNEQTQNSMYIIKLDSMRNKLFELKIEGEVDFLLSDIKTDEDENIVVVGFTLSNDKDINETKNFYLKIDNKGKVLTNINKSNPIQDLDFYPNPCNDYLILNSPFLNQKTAYTINSIDGRLVQQGDLSPAEINELNTSTLPQGMYILQISAGGKVHVAKFIKGY